MTLKIHEQGVDDLVVAVPTGWPALNVSGFQEYRSMETKTDSVQVQNLMGLAAVEVVENFDPEEVSLPLAGLDIVAFQYAVYELTFAKLLPLLQVHNRLDSEKVDSQAIANQARVSALASLDYQRRIPGFKTIAKKRISSMVV